MQRLQQSVITRLDTVSQALASAVHAQPWAEHAAATVDGTSLVISVPPGACDLGPIEVRGDSIQAVVRIGHSAFHFQAYDEGDDSEIVDGASDESSPAAAAEMADESLEFVSDILSGASVLRILRRGHRVVGIDIEEADVANDPPPPSPGGGLTIERRRWNDAVQAGG